MMVCNVCGLVGHDVEGCHYTPYIRGPTPSFPQELNDQGLNIRCVEVNLYNLSGGYFLDIDRVRHDNDSLIRRP